METKAEALDLGHLHGRSVRGYHLGEVFGKCINLLLEEEKGCTDGTQLSFVHDKGELRHEVVSASKSLSLQATPMYGRKKATTKGAAPLTICRHNRRWLTSKSNPR